MASQKECTICGALFSARHGGVDLCPECREFKKPIMQEPTPRQQAARPKKMVKTVDSYCRGCIHLVRVSCDQTKDKACDFIGHTGRPRPCPAGVGCTERRTRWDDESRRKTI